MMQSPEGQGRLARMVAAVSGVSQVLIVPHNDPDPDAIASAYALQHVLQATAGVTARIGYRGIIGRAENKALVRYLGNPLQRLSDDDLGQAEAVALVDTQPGAGNNPLPAGRPVAIAIDHHPPRDETAGVRFADIRPLAGATATILTEYLRSAGVTTTRKLTTALFYGIKTDTMGLSRCAAPADVAAYFELQPLIDVEALAEIERAQVPAEYFRRLAAALHAVRIYPGVVTCYLGEMSRPDLAAELADLLLRLEGTQWAVCLGTYQQELILSVRTRNRRGGAGQLARQIIGERGTAGGHGMMAAGHVPLRGVSAEILVTELTDQALSLLRVPLDRPGRPLIE